MRTELSVEDSKKIQKVIDLFIEVYRGPIADATPERYEKVIDALSEQVEFVAKWRHVLNDPEAKRSIEYRDAVNSLTHHYGGHLGTFESDTWRFAELVNDIAHASDSMDAISLAARDARQKTHALMGWFDPSVYSNPF